VDQPAQDFEQLAPERTLEFALGGDRVAADIVCESSEHFDSSFASEYPFCIVSLLG